MSTTASHSLPQILLLTHGGWGSQLCASLRMVAGDIQGVAEIALMPVDTFIQRVKQAVMAMPKGSLILTDFIGGTTSNVAARLSVDYPIGVICGLNASLLLQALELRETGLLTDAIEQLVEAGRDSCLDVVAHINSLQSNA